MTFIRHPHYYNFKNSLIIHKEKQKKIDVLGVSLYLIKTRLNFTSNFLDQNNPISKYQCKNKLIYITTVLK